MEMHVEGLNCQDVAGVDARRQAEMMDSARFQEATGMTITLNCHSVFFSISYKKCPHPDLRNVKLTLKIVKASCDSVSHYFLIVQKDKQSAQDFTSFKKKAFEFI